MRVLVTGGAGFIGSHLVDALVARGDEVIVLDDLSSGHRENLAGTNAELIVGSVADMSIVRGAVEGCALVFHEAAIASVPKTVESPLETNDVNLRGTLNVLQAAGDVGVGRVVFAGSAAVYGDDTPLPAREDAAPRPMSPYAVEKLASEHYLRVWSGLYGVEAVTLRYFNVFGPRQDPSSAYSGVISIFVDRLLTGRSTTIFGDGEQTRDFVFVRDVVQANLLAARVPGADGGVFNIARGDRTSLNDLYAHLARIAGGPERPEYGPGRSGDIRHSVADIDRARSVLGYAPVTSIADGLAALVDFERERLNSAG